MTTQPISLTIDTTGNIRIPDPETMRVLGAMAGDCVLTEATAGMLLLQRRGREEAQLLMAGRIRGLGWLVEVVNLIATARLSGRLHTQSDGVQRELCFESGVLRMANSTSTRDLIGEFLVGEGIITRQQLEKALGARSMGRRFGEVLVEQGLVGQADVFGVLVRRTERICLDAIALTHGSYSFTADLDVGRLPALLYLDTQSVLMEAVRQIDEGGKLLGAVLKRRAGRGAMQSLQDEGTASVRRFMECVDGKRSVAEIARKLSLGRLEAARIARQLIESGRLEKIGESAEVRDVSAVADRFNEALAEIYSAVRGALPESQLTEICRQYIKGGSYANKVLQLLVLEPGGNLNRPSVNAMAKTCRNRDDALRLIIKALTQYTAFVLFTANSWLGPQAQAGLTEKVNAMLGPVFSAVVV